MDIFSPSEICSKLTGVTPRQITDLAEKGIIIPAKDTPGQGSMRLYGKANIRELLIALSLRGIISGDALRKVLDQIFLSGPDVNAVSVNYGKRKNILKILAHNKNRDNTTFNEIEIGEDDRMASTPKLFINFWIDIGKIDEFIRVNF